MRGERPLEQKLGKLRMNRKNPRNQAEALRPLPFLIRENCNVPSLKPVLMAKPGDQGFRPHLGTGMGYS